MLLASGQEDLLKAGLTSYPLSRWPAFHRSLLEVFDLHHSLSVELDHRPETRALETSLHRAFVKPTGRKTYCLALSRPQSTQLALICSNLICTTLAAGFFGGS